MLPILRTVFQPINKNHLLRSSRIISFRLFFADKIKNHIGRTYCEPDKIRNHIGRIYHRSIITSCEPDKMKKLDLAESQRIASPTKCIVFLLKTIAEAIMSFCAIYAVAIVIFSWVFIGSDAVTFGSIMSADWGSFLVTNTIMLLNWIIWYVCQRYQ